MLQAQIVVSSVQDEDGDTACIIIRDDGTTTILLEDNSGDEHDLSLSLTLGHKDLRSFLTNSLVALDKIEQVSHALGSKSNG